MKRTAKIIFLDFDGVLNSMDWLRTFPRGEGPQYEQVDDRAVALLNKIVEQTGAMVVVSSTWRIGRKLPRTELQEILNKHGFKGIVMDVTPRSAHGVRGREIQEWLSAQSRYQIESFVIIDDSSDMAHLMPKLVRTTNDTGLTQEHVDLAVAMLSRPV